MEQRVSDTGNDELEILLKEVPVYHLECDISEDAVRCLEDVLAGGRGEE